MTMTSPRTPSKKSGTPRGSPRCARSPSPHQNDSTPLPSINERLAYLRPSRELLEYYRNKIAEYDDEHEELVKRLEKYKTSYDEQHKLQWEIRQREEEIAELQKALSDMQVYLFQEREHVLRLYAENDRLKIRELEDRKKIQHLLALVGTDTGEITYFHKEPPHKVTIHQRPIKSRNLHDKCDSHSSKIGTKDSLLKSKGEKSDESGERYQKDNQTLLLQVEALQAQLEEQTKLSKEQIEALLEDRRIHIEEAQVQHQRDQERIKDIAEKFHKAQNLLYDSTRDFLQMKFDARVNEKSWMAEKDRMLKKMDKCECAPKQSRVYWDLGQGQSVTKQRKVYQDSGRGQDINKQRQGYQDSWWGQDINKQHKVYQDSGQGQDINKKREGYQDSRRGQDINKQREGYQDSRQGQDINKQREGYQDGGRGQDINKQREGNQDGGRGQDINKQHEGYQDGGRGQDINKQHEGYQDSGRGQDINKQREGYQDSGRGQDINKQREGYQESGRDQDINKQREGYQDSGWGQDINKQRKGYQDSGRGQDINKQHEGYQESGQDQDINKQRDGYQDSGRGQDINKQREGYQDSGRGQDINKQHKVYQDTGRGQDINKQREGYQDSGRGQDIYNQRGSWWDPSLEHQDSGSDERESPPCQHSFSKGTPSSRKIDGFKKKKPQAARPVSSRVERGMQKIYGAEIKALQDKLTQEQKLADMYREQCVSLEEEVAKLREQGDAGRELFKQRSEKMGQRLQLMTQRYGALEKRRAMEVEGFKTDIRQLQQRLKGIEKQLFKVVMATGPDQDLEVLREVRQGNKRTKRIQGELKSLKSKIYGLENELRVC